MNEFLQGFWAMFNYEIFNSYGLGVMAAVVVVLILLWLVGELIVRVSKRKRTWRIIK